MSQKTTYTCDWCGETARDFERMTDWHLMWNLHSSVAFHLRSEQLEDLCPSCWKALETAVAVVKDERKKTT